MPGPSGVSLTRMCQSGGGSRRASRRGPGRSPPRGSGSWRQADGARQQAGRQTALSSRQGGRGWSREKAAHEEGKGREDKAREVQERTGGSSPYLALMGCVVPEDGRVGRPREWGTGMTGSGAALLACSRREDTWPLRQQQEGRDRRSSHSSSLIGRVESGPVAAFHPNKQAPLPAGGGLLLTGSWQPRPGPRWR